MGLRFYLCKSCKMFLLWWKWTIHTGLFCHYSSKQCGTLFVDVAVLGSNTNHFATAWPTLRCQDFNECLCIWMYLGLVIWFLILGRMYETFTQRQTHTRIHTHIYIHTCIHTHLDWTSKHPWCHGMIIQFLFHEWKQQLEKTKGDPNKATMFLPRHSFIALGLPTKAAPCPCRNKNKLYIFWGGPHTRTLMTDTHTHMFSCMDACMIKQIDKQTDRQTDRHAVK